MPSRKTLSPFLVAVAVLSGLAASSVAIGQSGQDVEILRDQVGLNGAYRPGGTTGIRVQLEASAEAGLDEASTVWVQWEVPNVDGDVAEYGRPITLTRGRAVKVWLYAPLDAEVGPNSQWIVRVFVFDNGRRGRELGSVLMDPGPGRVPIDTAVLGVVGTNAAGLSQYGLVRTANGSPPPTASEDTRVVFGIRPSDLPDRWEALRLLEALVWTDQPPQDLPAAQLEAVRAWVRRGGHLVIVLPDTGNPWGLGEEGRTGWHPVLPTRAPRVDEAVPLADLMPVIAKSTRLRAGVNVELSIRVFGEIGDEDMLDNGYEPLIALPDGRVVAVQRILGHGRITLLGINAGMGRLGSIPLASGRAVQLPQADVLWNRILGRRQDTPTPREVTLADEDKRLNKRMPKEVNVGTGKLMMDQVVHESQAGAGLAVALMLFLAYWLVAGPIGFALLKRFRSARHAWLAFAGAAGLFTVIAWISVAGLRQQQVVAKHVTFLDYIARIDGASDPQDPQLARATSWMSLYVPGYTPRPIDIASEPAFGPVPAQRDLLFSWSPPGVPLPRFPNVSRYGVDVRAAPDAFILPTRSTATLLEAHWLGAIPDDWGDMIRIDPDDPVRVEIDRAGREQLTGSLVNRLPGVLDDVQAIWVRNQRMPARRYATSSDREQAWRTFGRSGEMPNLGRMVSFGSWAPQTNKSLVFGDTADVLLESNLHELYVAKFETETFGAGSVEPESDLDRRRFMERLGLFGMLDPPSYLKPTAQTGEQGVAFRRMLGRELDLAPWFTRPCLIVTGFLRDSPTPVPLRMNGEPIASTGAVMVRWICPLPVETRVAFPPPQTP